VRNPALGWLCFGGNLQQTGRTIQVEPRDAYRGRLYIAPAGLWITLDSGRIRRAVYNPHTGSLRIVLDPATPITPVARLRILQPAKVPGVGQYKPIESLRHVRGAWVEPLGPGTTEIVLKAYKPQAH
jgi:hypothetical protein